MSIRCEKGALNNIDEMTSLVSELLYRCLELCILIS